ncbi:1,4-alpha-glucan branching protein GlgB [Lederbergia galactosidilytica]|uniref:1,4-alpha-glucan branching enzyme GlgB n=1 Tax=Lederbergia galactosidilytica TaxID=217031 RepID=A0A177ZIM5_9BACI|nr:1,4-alpha-glucan branching protein GlgB [Lederbergia galactosidilytica]KRG16452.1 1,4-alpha-glucan branching protein [Virgibacillus soli]OAK67329.1 1,4-alpha-glucan branching protein [Lederbergia galactosidilytica]
MQELIGGTEEWLPSDYEQYLFHEGTLYESYKMLGAHIMTVNGVKGVRFAVWAPNALSVSVVGDFNQWDGSQTVMNRIKHSGVWGIFIPGLKEGSLYKYELKTQEKEIVLKADPYAFYSERRPKTASIIYHLDTYHWKDQKWLEQRKRKDHYHQPMLIYEIHLGTWKKKADGSFYSYRELAGELITYVKAHGYTHIECMPLMEHPYDRSWGYQITGYFSVTSRFGIPEDFMYFVDQCHQNGIGVIMDWVPLHFCKDAHGLGRFDGTPLYEPIQSERAERRNWGTYNFDFSKPEVESFLISNAMFWLDVFHIDGFRIDAVSSMVYLNHDNAGSISLKNHLGGEENLEAITFIKKLNKVVFEQYPGILMMAEEATDYPLVSAPTYAGGLGFNYKWNMGWTNDVLRYMEMDIAERPAHHHLLTFSFFYAFSENFVLTFSHDEVVHGKRSLLNKMPGDYWQKFAQLRLLYGYFFTHPGKKLHFMGSEFAQFDEWKDLEQLDWNLFDFEYHKKFSVYFKALSHFYKKTSCLWRLDHEQEGFEWIDPNDVTQSVITFMRKGKKKGDYCIVLCNFSANVYEHYTIGVPSNGSYIEVFNSDLAMFGGSNQHNPKAIKVDQVPYHNQRYSMKVTVPPLGMIVLMKQTKKRRRSGFYSV